MNEVIEAIRSLLESQLWSTYKKYYYWDIKVPNQAMLPFVEVVPGVTNINNRGTWRMSDNEFVIQVRVKNTLKKYLKENTDVEVLEHTQDLVKKMEDRDSDMNIKSATILWVLMDNLNLNNKVHINDNWNIVYDEIDLWDSYIVFASVTFTAKIISY